MDAALAGALLTSRTFICHSRCPDLRCPRCASRREVATSLVFSRSLRSDGADRRRLSNPRPGIILQTPARSLVDPRPEGAKIGRRRVGVRRSRSCSSTSPAEIQDRPSLRAGDDELLDADARGRATQVPSTSCQRPYACEDSIAASTAAVRAASATSGPAVPPAAARATSWASSTLRSS